ncbi:NPC intracellular cholesterol transporter 2-like [Ruditapes philippinarum]|uniref:NPC intracellular cholesterol transporter 2-like n=1 Tax=Ruditapes philippinarum TaxID=129788 RepID=UPI00295B7AB9|nr:NPC intracellular cholesterol transporter 2-like [Ruditapes philippinarum]
MIKIITLLVVYLVSSTVAVQLKYISCGSTATVHSIALEPCASEPCAMNIGQNYTVWVNFTAKVNHDRAYHVWGGDVTGFGDVIMLNINPNDACIQSVKCPIQAGLQQTYKATVTIPYINPKRMALTWEVKSTNDPAARPIICFVFPVTILVN